MNYGAAAWGLGMEKLAVAKWRQAYRSGGELKEILQRAGASSAKRPVFVGPKGEARMVTGLSMPQSSVQRPKGQLSAAQRMMKRTGARGAVLNMIQRRRAEGLDVMPFDLL